MYRFNTVKNMTINLNKALEIIMKLDFFSREMLLEILQKRQIEERRKEIAGNAKSSKKAYIKGSLHSASAKDMISKLNTL